MDDSAEAKSSPVPHSTHYGMETQRAVSLRSACGVKISRFPSPVEAPCVAKEASAKVNMKRGLTKPNIGAGICQANDETVEGNSHDIQPRQQQYELQHPQPQQQQYVAQQRPQQQQYGVQQPQPHQQQYVAPKP